MHVPALEQVVVQYISFCPYTVEGSLIVCACNRCIEGDGLIRLVDLERKERIGETESNVQKGEKGVYSWYVNPSHTSTNRKNSVSGARLIHPNVFKPIRSTIFFVQKFLAVGEFAFGAPGAFWRVGTIKVRNVLVANVAEPRGLRDIISSLYV